MVVQNKCFFYSVFRMNKIRHINRIYKIESVLNNVINKRRMILEKFRKKCQILIMYDGERSVTNSNYRLKE